MKSSITSRIRITKTGKTIRRKMGQGHSLARLSGRQKNRRKKACGLVLADKIIKRMLHC